MFSSAGMPVIVIMLLLLCSAAMANPKATILALLATVGMFFLYNFVAAYIPPIPSDYLVIAIISCILGASAMAIVTKLLA